MRSPTLRGLALRTLLPAFPGTRPPAWALRLVRGGSRRVSPCSATTSATRTRSRALTAALRAARPDVIIATDEEGGDVTRLAYAEGSPYPGNAALGVVDDIELTRGIYHAIGAELAAVGITLDMAPAVDVNSADDNPTIGTRSFGADAGPGGRARRRGGGRAAVGGRGRVREALPRARRDRNWTPTTTCRSSTPPRNCSGQRELPPFVAAIDGGGARRDDRAHPGAGAHRRICPATFSPETLTGLLREETGLRRRRRSPTRWRCKAPAA